MTLEQLQQRVSELNQSLIFASQQVYILQGHKQEVEYQIVKLTEKIAADEQESLAKAAEPSVE